MPSGPWRARGHFCFRGGRSWGAAMGTLRLSERGSNLFVAAAGAADLSPGVSGRQWFEPYLRRHWLRAGWPYVYPLDSIAGSLVPYGAGDTRYPLTKGCCWVVPKDPPVDSVTHGQTAVQPFTGLREVQYHLNCNASWPGRKPCCAQRGGALRLESILRVAGGAKFSSGPMWVLERGPVEDTGVRGPKIILEVP